MKRVVLTNLITLFALTGYAQMIDTNELFTAVGKVERGELSVDSLSASYPDIISASRKTEHGFYIQIKQVSYNSYELLWAVMCKKYGYTESKAEGLTFLQSIFEPETLASWGMLDYNANWYKKGPWKLMFLKYNGETISLLFSNA